MRVYVGGERPRKKGGWMRGKSTVGFLPPVVDGLGDGPISSRESRAFGGGST